MGALTMHFDFTAAGSGHPDIAVDVSDMNRGASRNGATPIERRSIGLSARRGGGEQKDEEGSHMDRTGGLGGRFQGRLTQIGQAHIATAEQQDHVLTELCL